MPVKARKTVSPVPPPHTRATAAPVWERFPLPPALFLLMGLLIGPVWAFLTPPISVPDEFGHLMRAYAVSEGWLVSPNVTPVPQSIVQMHDYAIGFLGVGNRNRQQFKESYLVPLLEQPLQPLDQRLMANPAANLYSFVPYLPQAAGMSLARALQWAPLKLLYTGRLANLLVFLLLTALALHWTPAFHVPWVAVALMPMTMQQVASLSADGFTIASTFLLIAYTLRLMAEPRATPLTGRQYACLGVLIVANALSKFNVFLVLILVLIPAERFASRRQRWLSVAAGVLLAILAAAAWQQANRENIVNFRAFRFSLGVDVTANAQFAAAHPLLVIQAALHTILDYAGTYLTEVVGFLGTLSLPLPAWLVAVYLVVLLILMITAPPGLPASGSKRAWAAGLFAASITAIFFLLFTFETARAKLAVFSPESYVDGMQGRYAIPIFPLLFFVLGQRRTLPPAVAWGMAVVTVLIANVTAWWLLRTTLYAPQFFDMVRQP